MEVSTIETKDFRAVVSGVEIESDFSTVLDFDIKESRGDLAKLKGVPILYTAKSDKFKYYFIGILTQYSIVKISVKVCSYVDILRNTKQG